MRKRRNGDLHFHDIKGGGTGREDEAKGETELLPEGTIGKRTNTTKMEYESEITKRGAREREIEEKKRACFQRLNTLAVPGAENCSTIDVKPLDAQKLRGGEVTASLGRPVTLKAVPARTSNKEQAKGRGLQANCGLPQEQSPERGLDAKKKCRPQKAKNKLAARALTRVQRGKKNDAGKQSRSNIKESALATVERRAKGR